MLRIASAPLAHTMTPTWTIDRRLRQRETRRCGQPHMYCTQVPRGPTPLLETADGGFILFSQHRACSSGMPPSGRFTRLLTAGHRLRRRWRGAKLLEQAKIVLLAPVLDTHAIA